MNYLNAMQQLIAHPEKRIIHPDMGPGEYIIWKEDDDPFSVGCFYWHRPNLPDCKVNQIHKNDNRWEVVE